MDVSPAACAARYEPDRERCPLLRINLFLGYTAGRTTTCCYNAIYRDCVGTSVTQKKNRLVGFVTLFNRTNIVSVGHCQTALPFECFGLKSANAATTTESVMHVADSDNSFFTVLPLDTSPDNAFVDSSTMNTSQRPSPNEPYRESGVEYTLFMYSVQRCGRISSRSHPSFWDNSHTRGALRPTVRFYRSLCSPLR